ncbi:oxidoreductase [Oceanobacillus locisalsi]|uniref:FAD-dependent oxidoreductase n=1 Tax=Oceanobacillus locisalsi TaxID=546107 RepID=A0ABW3NER4_9BACI
MNITTETKLEKLFSPLTIGKKELKNRIVSAAHAVGWEADGLLYEEHTRYLERKAEGGTGLIIAFGSASVQKDSSASYGSISLWDERNEPAFKDLADRVHNHGALLISQATHMGRRGTSVIDGKPISAPSSVPEGVHNEIPHVMRTDEIPSLIQDFANAAKRLESCGWDGIEVTSFGGHLIEQFWSPKLNNRTDRYGGDFEGRMRFSIEVVETVRSAVSEDFIICFRMTGDPMTDALGLDREDMLKIATRLDQLGCIDLFNIGRSTNANYKTQAATVPGDTFERGLNNELAEMMKEHLSVPVMVAGRILDPYQAEEALLQEKCDLVGITRAIIADPDMPKLAEQGEFSRIRPCIACSEGCIGRLYSGMPMICTVNPAIADDSLEIKKTSAQKQKVIIIGGGPAGMEAARISAEKDNEVILLESSDQLGGKVLLTSVSKERPHYGLHVNWLKEELVRLGVQVKTNFNGTTKSILDYNPDVVILAIGSIQFNPFQKNTNVVTETEILSRKIPISSDKKVIVYDREGVYRGSSAALFAAEEGAKKVEIVTPHWSISDKLDDMRKAEMYSLLGKNKIMHLPNKELTVDQNDQLVIKDIFSNEDRIVEDNALVVLVGFEEGDNILYENIKSSLPEVKLHQIGDSVAPRRLHDAISEGAHVAANL